MVNTPRLAIFDVDGTIATREVVPPNVLAGMKHLHARGCLTTVSTGRGYVRLKGMLGDDFDTVISPEALLILEHGTKITNRDGQVVFGEFFTANEIDHVVDFARANIGLFKLIWFNPEDVRQKAQVWCQDERDLEDEIKKRGHYANVFTSPLGALKELLLQQHLTNITLKLQDYVKVENLKLAFTRTETNVIFQDGNMEFIKNNMNKGLAVRYVARELKVQPADILTAGNAINDIEMLDAGSGTTVLVGNSETRETILSYLSNPHEVITVDSPADLGQLLATL